MRLHCQFSTPVARSDVDDYVRHLVISIEGFSKDYDSYIVGKLASEPVARLAALDRARGLFADRGDDLRASIVPARQPEGGRRGRAGARGFATGG